MQYRFTPVQNGPEFFFLCHHVRLGFRLLGRRPGHTAPGAQSVRCVFATHESWRYTTTHGESLKITFSSSMASRCIALHLRLVLLFVHFFEYLSSLSRVWSPICASEVLFACLGFLLVDVWRNYTMHWNCRTWIVEPIKCAVRPGTTGIFHRYCQFVYCPWCRLISGAWELHVQGLIHAPNW